MDMPSETNTACFMCTVNKPEMYNLNNIRQFWSHLYKNLNNPRRLDQLLHEVETEKCEEVFMLFKSNELTRCHHTKAHQHSCNSIPTDATACSCVIAANSLSHSSRRTAHITMFRNSAVSDIRMDRCEYLQ